MMTNWLLGRGVGPPGFEVVEPRVVAAELQLDRAGRSVAVLGDDHLGDAWLFVGLVVLGAKKEHDHVGVLLDGPALTKVAEDRPLVRTLLWRAAQLGQRDDRNPQLA